MAYVEQAEERPFKEEGGGMELVESEAAKCSLGVVDLIGIKRYGEHRKESAGGKGKLEGTSTGAWLIEATTRWKGEKGLEGEKAG